MENLPRDLKVEELMRYEEDDDEFYEKIEAPKFVDFTAPDPFQPYDSSWFCVRIGCDQNHDDVDPDAIYRSFVLRVMAARSPNLQLRKTLTKQAPSVLKCPHSAPAKSAKSRMSRLSSVLASIPQKTIENKVKVSLVTKLTNNVKAKQSSAIAKALTTPKHKKCSQSSAIAKALTTPRHKQCSQSSAIAKAFTTPRHKKCPPNPEPFHSVQNPRVPNAIQKNTRMVVKALSFQTPKKSEKTSLKFHGVPTSDICKEIKQLKISNQMNKVPRHHCKSSRCMADGPNHLRPTSSPLKSQSRARKLQRNRIEVPSKYLKKISKPNVQKCQSSVPQEDVHDDSSHMEIDGKLRNVSFNTCPVNGHEESLNDPISTNLEVTCATEELLPSSEELSIRKNSLSKLEKHFNEEDHVKKMESLNIMEDETEISEGSDKGDTDTTEEESLPSSDESHNRKNSQSSSYLQETEDETENKERADKKNTVGTAFQVLNDKEQLIPSSNQVADELTEVTEPMDIADQENIMDTTEEESLSSSDESHNRENSLSNSDKTLQEIKDETEDKENAGKENTIERTPFRVLGTKELVSSLKASNGRVADEVAEPMDFASKENVLASDNNRDMHANIQHAKSKPHQQKACSNAQKVTREGKTMKERSATAATAIQGGKYKKSKPTNPKPFRFRTDERGILKEANLEKRMHHHDPPKEPAPVSRPLKRQPTRNKMQNRKSLGEERSHGESEKTAEKAQIQKRPAYQTKESKTAMRTEGQKLEDSKEKVVQKIRRTTRSPSLQQQLFSPQRGVISQGQLAVIKESSTISRTKEAPSETQAQKSTTNTASSRSSSRGKRPATVPKEPNFHSMHVPKSCTKTPTSMIS